MNVYNRIYQLIKIDISDKTIANRLGISTSSFIRELSLVGSRQSRALYDHRTNHSPFRKPSFHPLRRSLVNVVSDLPG